MVDRNILVAEDDNTSRLILEKILQKWGYDVTVAASGTEALERIGTASMPALALLDWIMPGLDGIEVCREIRRLENPETPVYIILLTGKDSKKDIVQGLNSGANDYVTKPFDNEELRARIAVGMRVIDLQRQVNHHVNQLQGALDHIKKLQGILPICSYCKNIRDDQNYWQKVESYISKNTDASFSHSICPDCYDKHIKPQMDKLKDYRKNVLIDKC